MENLKNIKSFDKFFESLSAFGGFINESVDPGVIETLKNSPEYMEFKSMLEQAASDPAEIEMSIIRLTLVAMSLVPERIFIALNKDTESGSSFIKRVTEVLVGQDPNALEKMYDILYENVLSDESGELIDAMALAEAKNGAFGEAWNNWLSKKSPEDVENWNLAVTGSTQEL